MIGKLTWLHGREASWLVRTKSGLKENDLDMIFLKEGNLLCDIA